MKWWKRRNGENVAYVCVRFRCSLVIPRDFHWQAASEGYKIKTNIPFNAWESEGQRPFAKERLPQVQVPFLFFLSGVKTSGDHDTSEMEIYPRVYPLENLHENLIGRLSDGFSEVI